MIEVKRPKEIKSTRSAVFIRPHYNGKA